MQNFLAIRAYKNAPVTLDNKDYLFAAYYAKMLARYNMPEAERTHKEYIRDMVSIFFPAPV